MLVVIDLSVKSAGEMILSSIMRAVNINVLFSTQNVERSLLEVRSYIFYVCVKSHLRNLSSVPVMCMRPSTLLILFGISDAAGPCIIIKASLGMVIASLSATSVICTLFISLLPLVRSM